MDSKTSQPGLFGPLADAIASDPDAAELEVLDAWRSRDVFREVQAARKDAPPFVFWEGPPTANGRPGIHHVMARTIKDTVCRYQTMLGKRVDRKAGWDTHGLPVELEVEKSLGISGKPQIEEYGVAEFNAKCRESVWKYREEWERISERIGFWLDYDDPYVTYDERYVESVWNILARFHRAGLVYQGKRVVPYCGRCGTGLSSHEIGQPGVYRDLLDPSVTVRFRVDAEDGGEAISLLAWTTTPWTLPSNVALAVHPRVEYVLARVALPVAKGEEAGSAGYERVWIAAARAQAVLGDFEELERCQGVDLVGTSYHPLFDHPVTDVEPGAWEPDPALRWTVVPADYVSTEDGTGIVHQAPSYGADDWTTANENDLPVAQAVGAEGRFVADFGPVPAGTFFKDADDALMEDLKQRGLMFKKARENHSYPHCWRCDTPLFYYATPAWYIRTTSYKDRMIEYNRRCNWVPPEVGEKRFSDWLENNIDWNISRERYWGTPLPFWVCDRDDTHQRALGSVEEMRAAAGGLPDGFDNHKPSIDQLRFACEECGGTMVRTKSVVDCWFDSGSMPYAQHHWPFGDSQSRLADQFPADFIAEGLDQTRGWFYSLLAVGAFVAEDAPELPKGVVYQNCVVNGLVLDKDGVKMSKRLGNIVDPWEAVKAHGIDAVRWYMLSSGAPWLPKRFDMEGVLEVRRRFLGTLINSYRFLADYARIDGFRPRDAAIPRVAERPEIDRWLASRSESLVGEVRARMSEYDLSGACRAVEGFVVDELSNWYIRRNRRRFWKGGAGPDKQSAYATLHGALRTVALLIAPAAPFLAEMLWERLQPGDESVHAQFLPVADELVRDERLEASMRVVERVVEMGRALRERNNLRVRQPLRAIHLRASDPETLELLRSGFASELVLDELNIKSWGSLDADDGQLCTLRAKANFKTLGKRLGKQMKAAAAAIGELEPDRIAALRSGGSVTLELEGETVELTAADVDVSVESRADFDVEADGRMIVFLDTELDDALLREGLAREAVNRLNGLRKQAGLAIDDRIRLNLDARGEQLGRALLEHGDFIAAETLAEAWQISKDALPGTEWSECELGDGELLRVSLARA
ncbi:MAG: isoleucine--tRNA ligase [Planctomycetes bacterium]|nr:isoleucine--tRNA ligase [Planctomycetota bacterium]